MVGRVLAKDEVGVRFSLSALGTRKMKAPLFHFRETTCGQALLIRTKNVEILSSTPLPLEGCIGSLF